MPEYRGTNELAKELYLTGLFTFKSAVRDVSMDDYPGYCNVDAWWLKGTSFFLVIDFYNFEWFYRSEAMERDFRYTFEKVFERLEPELKEKLLFHLDLFR